MSTKNDLCPLWIAISWRVQVRKCSHVGTKFWLILIFLFVVVIDKWTKPVDETKLIHDPALLPSVL